MSPIRVDAGLLLAVALVLSGTPAEAQPLPPPYSQTATVAVSLRVLPQASFEDGAEPPVSAELVPGAAVRVNSAPGVRTRMTYSAATKLVVTGTLLRGPGGATLHVRFVCAFGGGITVSAAEPFDCIGGLLAGLEGARPATLPLAIGAELGRGETRGVPPGLYTGRVTLTATNPGF